MGLCWPRLIYWALKPVHNSLTLESHMPHRPESLGFLFCQLQSPLVPTLAHLSPVWVEGTLAHREQASLSVPPPPPPPCVTSHPWVLLFHRKVSRGRDRNSHFQKSNSWGQKG
jgi:hypothetical protein